LCGEEGKLEIKLRFLTSLLFLGILIGCKSYLGIRNENDLIVDSINDSSNTKIGTCTEEPYINASATDEQPTTRIKSTQTTDISTQTLVVNQYSTRTLLPTLPLEESREIFGRWLIGDDNCLLPCWAGVVPGEMSWQEANRLIEPVLTVDEVVQDYSCFSKNCSGFWWSLPDKRYPSPVYGSILEVNGDFITDISVTIRTSEYQIPMNQVFLQYGAPSRILIYAGYFEIDNYVSNKIILFYPLEKFIIRYDRSGWLSEGNLLSCGAFEATDLRIATSIESDWNNDQILVELDGELEQELFLPYYDLEKVTEFSISAFIEMVFDDPDLCFEIKE
jgi:hypothetical protein